MVVSAWCRLRIGDGYVHGCVTHACGCMSTSLLGDNSTRLCGVILLLRTNPTKQCIAPYMPSASVAGERMRGRSEIHAAVAADAILMLFMAK